MRERREIGRSSANLGSIRLEPGSHASPGDGVCIVELASLVGKEKFSDHPRCVCEVIAAFLRGWNDRSSHAERQRLLPYGERIVGSRADRAVTRARRDVCLTWAGADLTGNSLSCARRRLAMRLRILVLCGIGAAARLNEGAGELAARVVFARYGPEAGFRVIDALLAIGPGSGSAPPTANGSGPGPNGSPDVHREEALARALIERAARASANGAQRASNGSGPERERRREPARSG
jgi:hypothetical protein